MRLFTRAHKVFDNEFKRGPLPFGVLLLSHLLITLIVCSSATPPLQGM